MRRARLVAKATAQTFACDSLPGRSRENMQPLMEGSGNIRNLMGRAGVDPRGGRRLHGVLLGLSAG